MSMHSNEKSQPWLLPADRRQILKAGLYLIGTPVGNLYDISVRALDILAAADLVICEDTRISGKLLSHYGLRKKLLIYNDHSDDSKRLEILKAIQAGQLCAFISDAGMPLVSDPGYKLVQAVRAENLYLSTVPGASAPLLALQLSGAPSDRFSFIGFLPPKQSARINLLREWASVPGTLLAFETAPRLMKALEDIASVMGERRVSVARELTKLHEEIRSGSARELLIYYQAHGEPKGEIVLVLDPSEAQMFDPGDVEALLRTALKTLPPGKAAAQVAQQTGHPRKTLYDLALALGEQGLGGARIGRNQ